MINQDRSHYRAFRSRIIEDAKPSPSSWSHYEDASSFARRREQIAAFRNAVRKSVAALLAEDPQNEPHVRRALGIPSHLSLETQHCSAWRSVVQFFMPTILGARKARSLFTQVKTYEGRHYLFDNLIVPEFAWHSSFPGRVDFSPSLDLLLRRSVLPTTWSELNEAQSLNLEWLKIAQRFNVKKMAELVSMARYGHFQLNGDLAWMLVQERVVNTRLEVSRLGRQKESYAVSADASRGYTRQARRMIRVLLDHDVAREEVATIFNHDLHRFNPERLDTNLTVLRAAEGVNLSSVFKAVGDLLWRGKTENWIYVLHTLGARTPEDIAQFGPMLDAHYQLPVDFALALKSLGADLTGLAQCQSLILRVSQREDSKPAINELKYLGEPPFELNIEQISQCTSYLSDPERVKPFLNAVAAHGYVSGAAVLAFQVCYQRLRVEDVDAWLGIAGSVRGQPLPEVVADWVRQAGSGGYLDAFRYLREATDLCDFKGLQQALPVVHLGRTMLRYVVEVRGLIAVQAIKKWYYDARGIELLRIDDTHDAVSRLLLDDAYTRNNFSVLSGNMGQTYSAVRERVDTALGKWPGRAEKERLLVYQQQHAELMAVERHALLEVLPIVLEQTEGLLLRSVLRYAWDGQEALNATLERLKPLIQELMAGRGPIGSQLDELEADAIAMLYRTSPDTVTSLWSRVINQQAALSWLNLRSKYPMTWQRSFRRLNGTLERQSLLALAQAAAFAEAFSLPRYQNISDACKSLKSKRLYDDARDPWSLAAHLGVLLAAASNDALIKEWISNGLESASQIADEGKQTFERIEQLGRLFEADLPDALDQYAARFLERFDDGDARFLAERLVGTESTCPDGGRELLDSAFALTRKTVLETGLKWVARERAKFVRDKTRHATANLAAVLSKHPAAFFAKHAANLCSRGNTAMWVESRQAHLVVFDPAQSSLAGMALVYFQVIPELHKNRMCLVIRGINPMDDMLATHTESSVVDAFLEVAITIAQDNSLAAVVLPDSNGTHLLSNRHIIEKDLLKRFVAQSAKHYGYRRERDVAASEQDLRAAPRAITSTFYAYEEGAEKVNDLYVIWLGAEEVAEASEYPELESVV